MIVVMVLLVALLGAGAIALSLQTSNTKSTGYVRQARSALYCAEAGLNRARSIIAANYDEWPLVLDPDLADPVWYPIRGDLDGDGTFDYIVTMRDNDDEIPTPGAPNIQNDLTRDNDNQVFAESQCLMNPEMPRRVLELLAYSGGGNNYTGMDGQGALGSNNANPTIPAP